MDVLLTPCCIDINVGCSAVCKWIAAMLVLFIVLAAGVQHLAHSGAVGGGVPLNTAPHPAGSSLGGMASMVSLQEGVCLDEILFMILTLLYYVHHVCVFFLMVVMCMVVGYGCPLCVAPYGLFTVFVTYILLDC